MLFYLSLLLLLFLFRVFRFLNDSCFFLYISTVTLIFCCSVEFSVFLNIKLLYINTSILALLLFLYFWFFVLFYLLDSSVGTLLMFDFVFVVFICVAFRWLI